MLLKLNVCNVNLLLWSVIWSELYDGWSALHWNNMELSVFVCMVCKTRLFEFSRKTEPSTDLTSQRHKPAEVTPEDSALFFLPHNLKCTSSSQCPVTTTPFFCSDFRCGRLLVNNPGYNIKGGAHSTSSFSTADPKDPRFITHCCIQATPALPQWPSSSYELKKLSLDVTSTLMFTFNGNLRE